MKRIAVVLVAAALLGGPVSGAQLYRWVDERGRVEWRDTPPPAGAKKIERRKVGGGAPPAAELPYALQVAVKNFPVTLWVTDCGDACTRARAHLERRGVPHTEKDPRSDFANFKKLTGSAEVPVVFVGSTRLKGYLESDWDAALDQAGYPRTPLVKPQPKRPAAQDTGGAPAEGAAPPEKGAAAPADPAATPTAAGIKLYTTPACGPNCAEARQLLGARGVGFQEVQVVEDPQIEELKKLTGDTVVPVLHLGQFWVQGYNLSDYQSALDKAGYKRPPAAE